MDIKKLQQFLDGDWISAAALREALLNNSLEAFLIKNTPRPFFLNILAYLNYNKCLTKCLEITTGPRDVETTLFPVWLGYNPDDKPSSKWKTAFALHRENQPLEILELNKTESKKYGFDFNSIITLKLKTWNVGVISHSRYYAPSVQLPLRGVVYCVVEVDSRFLEKIIKTETREPMPLPTEKIAPFSQRILPAVIGIPDDVRKQLESMEIRKGESK